VEERPKSGTVFSFYFYFYSSLLPFPISSFPVFPSISRLSFPHSPFPFPSPCVVFPSREEEKYFDIIGIDRIDLSRRFVPASVKPNKVQIKLGLQGGPKKTAHGFKAITLPTLNHFS